MVSPVHNAGVASQSTGITSQFPNRYRHDRLLAFMNETGHTAATTAAKANLSKTTIAEALVGECKKFTTLWDIAWALTEDEKRCQMLWQYLFTFNSKESEFRRAVAKAGRR